jgi:hypothetical protein
MGARRVVGLQRPVAAHLLERHPPEEQRVGDLPLLSKHRLDVRYGVLAAGGAEAALGRFGDPSSVIFAVMIRPRMLPSAG